MHYDRVTAPDHGRDEVSEHGIPRTLGGWPLRALMAIALAFSTFQLIVAAFHPLSSLVIRSLHVGFLLAMTFVLYPSFRHGARLSRVPWHDWLLAAGAFALSTYHRSLSRQRTLIRSWRQPMRLRRAPSMARWIFLHPTSASMRLPVCRMRRAAAACLISNWVTSPSTPRPW